MVEFGFAVPASLHEIPVSVRVETAEQVEALGYESFWSPCGLPEDFPGGSAKIIDDGGGSHGGANVQDRL